MQNENGENVDLYVPRKCSWTNRLVEAKDHSSVQINVANVDPVTGLGNLKFTTERLEATLKESESRGGTACLLLIATMIVAGKSNKEIAAEIFLSPKTVDKHRTSLMSKLEVHSVAQLMAKAIREGLVEPDSY